MVEWLNGGRGFEMSDDDGPGSRDSKMGARGEKGVRGE